MPRDRAPPRRLAQGTLAIAGIAGVGDFSSQSHFTAGFRRLTAATARRWRAVVN